MIIQHWFFKIRGDLAGSKSMSLLKRVGKENRIKRRERVSIDSKKLKVHGHSKKS